ncbi:MAG TPA: GNAT family N-acetyltransferase [Chryseolinea sp.]|nr:GNAT family N-acetyltransferase [Chryseolinea sp.]
MYTTARRESDLHGILELQGRNLVTNLSAEDILGEGFVTVRHSLDDLQKMNAIEQHVIARDNDIVIAYLLAMTSASRNDIPVLVPMFEIFESIQYDGQPLAAFNFIVVGQVCVDKAYRGQGVFDTCYQFYRTAFQKKYQFAVTEIVASNHRSQRAHERVGFKTIHQYIAPDKEVWNIVLLDWRKDL